jgi:hypothetical protein
MMRPPFNRDESNQRVARYEVRAMSLSKLRDHLPAMRTTADELAHSAAHLQLTEGKAFVMQSWYGMGALGDLHAAAIADLEQGRDFGAMVLAQEGIRLAVDVTYVFCDPEGNRVEASLRRLLDAQRERVSRWQRACPDDAQPGPWLARLDGQCRQSPWFAQAPEWPPLVSRAEAVGLASWIHPIFSGTSSASEAATQQFMNYLECAQLHEPERSAAHTCRSARCMSDALYVESVALLLFAHALHLLAANIGDVVATTVAEAGKKRMESILAEHDELAEAHVNDKNLYMGVRSPRP